MPKRAGGSFGAQDDAVTMRLGHGDAAVAFQLSGTFSATVTFEGTLDGSNWEALEAEDAGSGTQATTATAAGIYLVPTAGLEQVRARCSTYVSGTVEVDATASGGAPHWS